MNTIHIDCCPVCGSKNITFSHRCTDYYATGGEFDLFRCADCGFLFTQNFPNEQEIGHYYDTKDYVSHSDTRKGIVNKLYHIVRNYMLNKKADVVKLHTHTSSRWLLDVGCGTGYFLSHMAKQGWFVKGIEKNKSARDLTHKQFGLIIDEPEELNKYEELTFGVITLWHSLEHLEKLNETMLRLNKLLVENGTLVIAVPNAQSADAAHYQEKWAAYDVPRHLWHFMPGTLKKLSEKNGFCIEKMYPMPFDAFYVSMLSEKYSGQNTLSFLRGAWVGLKCYFKAHNKVEQSSSIIYILKKAENFKFKV